MNLSPAFFILSAAIPHDYPGERRQKSLNLERHFKRLGYAFAMCDGCYKGELEQSILVIDENPGRDTCQNDVLRLAKVYGQETVLSVDVNRAATLVSVCGPERWPLGRFTCVPKETALAEDSYTKRGAYYYVCIK